MVTRKNLRNARGGNLLWTNISWGGGGFAGLEMTLRTCIKLLFTLRFVLDQRLARLEIQGSVMGCFNRACSNISKYTYLCIFDTKKYFLLLRIFILSGT